MLVDYHTTDVIDNSSFGIATNIVWESCDGGIDSLGWDGLKGSDDVDGDWHIIIDGAIIVKKCSSRLFDSFFFRESRGREV